MPARRKTSITPLAIIGDGIAGYAMALAFARKGHELQLISSGRGAVPGGVQMAPNTWSALAGLGVREDLEAMATPLMMMRLLSLENGITLVSLPLNDRPGRHFYASMRRARLIETLAKAVEATGRVEILTGTVHRITQKSDHAEAALDDGRAVKAAWLIGADGAAGISRQYVEAGGTPQPQPRRLAFRMVLNKAQAPGLAGRATNVWLGRGGHIVHYPLDGEDINLVVMTSPSSRAVEEAARMLTRQQRLAPAADALEASFAQPLMDWPLLDTWQRGRVILAGDAAHPMPPHLAQGAGQSLIDAAAMVRRLEHISPGDDLQPVFSAWSAERVRQLSGITRDARRAGDLFSLEGPLARVRNIGLHGIGNAVLGRHLDRLWSQ
ncbi:FAD-dependent monooxygenase [Alphaproteobacteria bacterium LSUCC0684]